MDKTILMFSIVLLLHGCGTVNVKNIETNELPKKIELNNSLKKLERKFEIIALYEFEKTNGHDVIHPFNVQTLINTWGKPDKTYKEPNPTSEYVKANLSCGVVALIPGLQTEAVLCFAGGNGLIYGLHKLNTKQTLTWNINNKRIKVYTSEKKTDQGLIQSVDDWEWCESDAKNGKYYYSDGEKCL